MNLYWSQAAPKGYLTSTINDTESESVEEPDNEETARTARQSALNASTGLL